MSLKLLQFLRILFHLPLPILSILHIHIHADLHLRELRRQQLKQRTNHKLKEADLRLRHIFSIPIPQHRDRQPQLPFLIALVKEFVQHVETPLSRDSCHTRAVAEGSAVNEQLDYAFFVFLRCDVEVC